MVGEIVSFFVCLRRTDVKNKLWQAFTIRLATICFTNDCAKIHYNKSTSFSFTSVQASCGE